MLRRIWRASIWHPDAIPVEEWKYRHAKRVWLPLYDIIMVGAGLWATAYGSPILNRLYGPNVIDVMGMMLAFVATICLLGVSLPRLWMAELSGKILLIFLLATYAVAVLLFRTNPDPASGFVVFIIFAVLPLPLWRLQQLAEEWQDRRDAAHPAERTEDD